MALITKTRTVVLKLQLITKIKAVCKISINDKTEVLLGVFYSNLCKIVTKTDSNFGNIKASNSITVTIKK